MSDITLVTGIWDLDRSNAPEGWNRSFDHYIEKFKQLLTSAKHINMCIFIDPSLEDMVWEIRDRSNTRVYHHKKDEFSGDFFPFFDSVQEIRKDPEWLSQVGWLSESTQAILEYYNPMVMSKMFMLHNAKCYNPFGDQYYFWIDGGITNTIHPGYFSHDKVIEKLKYIVDKFLFVCFPYKTNTEIHGFNIDAMNRIANSKVDRVARGGIFGGHIDIISEVNDMYYGLLRDTLSQKLMGTEESIFTLMTYIDPSLFNIHMIEDNGLLGTFFENLKNYDVSHAKVNKTYKNDNVVLYINAFNSPEQLELLMSSFEKYDNRFISNTKLILINNSTVETCIPQYEVIYNRYNFSEHILKGNMGVCGARQFAAEHFADTGSKYMLFFEDDMLLDMSNTKCNFGFNKFVPNFFDNMIKLMNKEYYDILKLTFSEFYGHNGDQWSWHNVPSPRKEEYFGVLNKKPLTKFTHIKSFEKIPYVEGEIYYSNWPQIVTQEGNKKMFLDTKWQYPYEQTWMSHIYTLTKENIVKPGLLLCSPITHNRVYFYHKDERREN
jgi:hypothetical protein